MKQLTQNLKCGLIERLTTLIHSEENAVFREMYKNFIDKIV